MSASARASWRRILSGPPRSLRKREWVLEFLETRELLSLSVTAPTLLGPSEVVGTTWTYESRVNGALPSNWTDTVNGPATFNAHNCVATDYSVANSDGSSQTGKYFRLLTSVGQVVYGEKSVFTSTQSVINGTTTYAPPAVVVPPSMTAGMPITSNESFTMVLDQNGSIKTEVFQQQKVLTLESVQQPVTTTTGSTYKCYVIDQTVTANWTVNVSGLPPATFGPITTTTQLFFAPEIGLARQIVKGTGYTTEFLLTSFKAGPQPPHGSALSVTVGKNTLPASVVAGGASHGSIVVNVKDTGTAKVTGTVTAAIFGSQNGQIDSSSVLLGKTRSTLTIAHGAVKALTVTIKSVPANMRGTYTLLAQVTDPSGKLGTSSKGPSLKVAAPFLAFSDTIVSSTLAPRVMSGHMTSATVRLKVINKGNIASTGASQVALYVSPGTDGTGGTLIRTLSVTLALKPGGTQTVTISLKALPAVANGKYYLVALVTDPRGGVSSAASKSRYSLVAP